MNTHTNYFVINEKSQLELITYAPDQSYAGQRASDSYALAQGLFIDNISHDLWLTDALCHRVVGTPSGLHTVKGLTCKIVAKSQYEWDMSKPMGERKQNEKKSAKWDECYLFYRSQK